MPTPKFPFTVQTAMHLAYAAHHGQTRNNHQTPYIKHVEDVAQRGYKKGYCDEALIAFWLHDVVEDTHWTLDMLRQLGVPEESLVIIEIVTKKEGEAYPDFIERICKSNNLNALRLKTEDILSNLNDSPSKKQLFKYGQALARLYVGV